MPHWGTFSASNWSINCCSFTVKKNLFQIWRNTLKWSSMVLSFKYEGMTSVCLERDSYCLISEISTLSMGKACQIFKVYHLGRYYIFPETILLQKTFGLGRAFDFLQKFPWGFAQGGRCWCLELSDALHKRIIAINCWLYQVIQVLRVLCLSVKSIENYQKPIFSYTQVCIWLDHAIW